MCGGGSYTYSSPTRYTTGPTCDLNCDTCNKKYECYSSTNNNFEAKRKTFEYLWGVHTQNIPDASLFVEVVRGCSNTSCVYQCQARTYPVEVLSVVNFIGILSFIKDNKSIKRVIYHGMGDAELFPWFSFTDIDFPERENYINLSSTCNPALVTFLERKGIMVGINVHSIEDAKRCTELYKKASRVIVPINSDVPWEEIVEHLRSKSISRIECNSLTPSSSSKYVNANIFNSAFKTTAKEYKLVPGFKPVIMNASNTYVTIRRCFQHTQGDEFYFNKSRNADVLATFNSLISKIPDCHNCSDLAWSWTFGVDDREV